MMNEFREIAENIAREMGGWEARREFDTGPYIIQKDDQSFYLNFGGWKNEGKVSISARYPERARELYRVEHPVIKVSYSRGAATIAKEINRRLMPSYLTALADVQQRLKEMETAESRQESIAFALADALGVSRPNREKYSRSSQIEVRTGWHGDYSKKLRAEFEVMYGGDVKIEVNTKDADIAVKIAEFLRTLKD
ncbi:hypothetical protein [Nonomuraea sp. NPDC049141]|uniref:hypothetical protein n=1 Tax=Nonomuraea sp. NPDC049141 TaxID=3155500 RepID=UPI003409C659